MLLGIDKLISDAVLRAPLRGKRLAVVGHPASMTSKQVHTLDALMICEGLNVTAAFGPQHGMRGEKQDNMVETPDYVDPVQGIPVFSLYGDVRRPTDLMMSSFDVLLFDVQDIGCRIYTYVTTLLYLLEACREYDKALWVLDRPNPAGRPIEGSLLTPGWESFVGAGQIMMRHGLTMGEMAEWFVKHHDISVDLQVVAMDGYDPKVGPGYGWPLGELSWINPSPNASSVNMTRFYAGSVLLEGTTLSEGRGTTMALEVLGAPDIDMAKVLIKMQDLAPQWMQGSYIRPCYFQPTFHKHQGELCQGYQVHTDSQYYQHRVFKPFRLVLLSLKAIRLLYPNYHLWRDFPYEYETRLAFDVINGGSMVREWVDDLHSTIADMEDWLCGDEQVWQESIADILRY